MTSEQRVLTAFEFQQPDRIPVYDRFWEFPPEWRQRLGPPERLTDISLFVPDETPFPSRAGLLKQEGEWQYEVDSWGRTIRRRPGAFFVEVLGNAVEPATDPEAVQFESPSDDRRYYQGQSKAEFEDSIRRLRASHYAYVKTGGPYLRTALLVGQVQFLSTMASDPTRARAWADKVAEHITCVGLEALRRSGLQGNGLWIYDDMGSNRGPLFSPGTFEQVLLPAYRRMIAAFRRAGARYVLLHSDGDIRPLLDMLIEAGIEGLNPVERRAGMDMVRLRRSYPRLILTGGMCNTCTLLKGPLSRIEAEAREIIELGRSGGVVIGTHSISPEVPLEHYVAYRRVCETFGVYQ